MKKSKIFSIFGQIETVVAEAMVAEGKCTKIEKHMIPSSALYNEDGMMTSCALLMNEQNEREFNNRVRILRA